jgi:hypothetical protein
VNPTNNKVVYRGPSATQLGFTYPAIVAASKILGYSPPEWEVDNVMDIWYKRTVFSFWCAEAIPPPIPTPAGYMYKKNLRYQIPVKPQELTWWTIFGNSFKQPFYNRNHIWKLATISGLVDQEDFYDFCTPKRPYFEIINAVFNNFTTIKDKNYYTNILLNSYCNGSRHYNHPPDYSRIDYWGTEDFWSFSDNMDEDDHPREGDYNGLDFMLMHNLYRLAFVSNTSTTYSTNTCPCTSSKAFAPNSSNVNTITSINTLKEDIPFRFPDYKNYNIEIPEWLTQNFTINSGGILRPQGDMSICGSTTIVNTNGKLSTSTNTVSSFYKKISIGPNAILEVKANGVLNIENNTMIVINEGGKLIFHPGARIILNGSNAVLKFNQGKLFLKSGAEFKVEAGINGHGFVHFHQNWLPNEREAIQCEDNTAKFIIEGTYLNDNQYYNDKILEISGNIGLNTDWKLKNFIVKKGFIAIGKGSQIVSNAEYTFFNKCHLNTPPNSTGSYTDKHNGIYIPGRLNKFEEVKICNATTGIRYTILGGLENLKLLKVKTVDCNIGVSVIGGGLEVRESEISGRSRALIATGTSNLSIFEKSFFDIGGIGVGEKLDVVLFHGSRLYAWKNTFRHGYTGLTIGDARATLKCNTFNENKVNLTWYNSPTINLKSYNSFSAQCNQQIYGNGNTILDFKDNYNKYLQPDGFNSSYIFEINYSIKSPWSAGAPDYADGGNNCYYQGGGIPIDLITNPNYSLSVSDNVDYVPLQLETTPNINLTNIATNISSGCTDGNQFTPFYIKSLTVTPTENRKNDAVQGPLILKNDNNTRPVKVSDAYSIPATKPLSGALIDNYQRLYERVVPDFDSAINEISNILSQNTIDDTLSTSPYMEDMYFMYDMLVSAYSDLAFYKDSADTTNLNLYQKVISNYPKVDTLFQSLWEQSQDTNSMWFERKYQLAKDWSEVNRLANQNERAIEILQMAIEEINSVSATLGLNKWACVNEFELALKSDTSMNWDTVIASYGCVLGTSSPYDTISQADSTIHFCDWNSTIEGFGSFVKFQSDENLASFEMLTPKKSFLEVKDSGFYELTSGVYKLIYFDTLTFETRVLSLTIVGDTQTVESSDSIMSYCDWNKYSIKSNVRLERTPSKFYSIYSVTQNMYTDTNELYAGEYIIQDYDTSSCRIVRMNLTIIADTIALVDLPDSTIYMYGIKNDFDIDMLVSALNPSNLPFFISFPLDSVQFNDSSAIGEYSLNLCDTMNCIIYKRNLTLINLSPDFEIIGDTIITYCPVNEAYKGYIYSSILGYPFDVFNSDDSISVDDSSLYPGNYFVHYYDTTNNIVFKYNITLQESTQYFESDTSYSYCTFDSSYLFEKPEGIVTEIYKLDSDTILYQMENLIKGNYKIISYDDNICTIYTTNIEILELLPDTTFSYDTINYVCGSEVFYSTSLEGTMKDPSGNSLSEYTANNYLLDPKLGNYTFYGIVHDSCDINKLTISFNSEAIINDTSMQIDSISYYCDTESDSVVYSPNCQGVIIDNSWSAINPNDSNQYILNPQEGHYYMLCRDTANCTVHKTILYFKDNISVPSSTLNYMSGIYNRTQNPCCFIDLTEVECDGETPLTFGQEIQVYSMNTDFLYQTNLDLYNGTVLGFRFCQPYWNTDSNIINNWYSIVIRNDECSFCRMDFMCDSLGDPEPFVILNYPSGKLIGGVSQTNGKAKTNGAAQAVENKPIEEKLPMSVSVYPNPATSEVSVKIFSANTSNLTIQISDAAGKPIYSSNYETSSGNLSIKVNLEDFANGVYTVYIPELNYNYKLVIIR